MKYRIIPPNRSVNSWTVEGFYQDGKWKFIDTFKSKPDALECIKKFQEDVTEDYHYKIAQEKAEYHE